MTFTLNNEWDQIFIIYGGDILPLTIATWKLFALRNQLHLLAAIFNMLVNRNVKYPGRWKDKVNFPAQISVCVDLVSTN